MRYAALWCQLNSPFGHGLNGRRLGSRKMCSSPGLLDEHGVERGAIAMMEDGGEGARGVASAARLSRARRLGLSIHMPARFRHQQRFNGEHIKARNALLLVSQSARCFPPEHTSFASSESSVPSTLFPLNSISSVPRSAHRTHARTQGSIHCFARPTFFLSPLLSVTRQVPR